MPKVIVSIDEVVIKEVQITKDKTTLGRRPYNDMVIDNLAVSGEHAVLQMTGNEVYIEERTVDVHIKRLRAALALADCDRYIETVRGSGYRITKTPTQT